MFVNRRPRYDRGQALLETAIALPLELTTLFGIIFFSRLGVVAERSQRAVRYGAEVVPPPTYLPQMYEALYDALTHHNGQLQKTNITTCPGVIQTEVQSAVTNNENRPLHLAAAQTYWSPDTAAVASCSINTVVVPFVSSYNEVFTLGIAESLKVAVDSKINPPSYLSALFPGSLDASATDYSLNPVTPTLVLSCTPTITDPVVEVMWPSFSPFRLANNVNQFQGQPTNNSDAHANKVC